MARFFQWKTTRPPTVKLTRADKLALIYTSAGSLRGVAGLVGVSARTVRDELLGVRHPNRRADYDAMLSRAVDVAFSIHSDVTRQQARADDLPFDPRLPVFLERFIWKDGTPGDRVGAMHVHWLSDRLRDAWLGSMHESGKFYQASVQSIVNLVVYNKRAEERVNRRDAKRARDRDTIQNKIQQQIITGPIYTPYTPLKGMGDDKAPLAMVLQDIQIKLRTRHEPATGDAGTALASGVLFQVDTRRGRDDKFRDAHPFKQAPGSGKRKRRAKAKRGKASGVKKRRR